MRDELVGLIASWDREGREGERSFYLEAWNGNASFDTDRIGRGSIFIENLCVSIFGGIQPDKLVGYLEQATHADGFTARDVRRNQWRYLTTDEAVNAALDWLEDEGWLQSQDIGGTGPGTGRRTSRYFINPAVQGAGHGQVAGTG